MGGESNGIPGGYSTDARLLGGPVELDADTRLFDAAASDASATGVTVRADRPPSVPQPNVRLNTTGALSGGDPYLSERSFSVDSGASVRVRTTIDGDGAQDPDISNVRVSGRINDSTQYQVNVGSNQVVNGGVAVVDPENPRTSAAVGVTVDTKPNALNAVRLNANGVYTPPGSDVGITGSYSTNALDSRSPSSSIAEIGVQYQPGKGGRDAALGITGVTAGYRSTTTDGATGTTRTDAGFLRLTGVPLGTPKVTADGELSVDARGQSATLGVNWNIDSNNALRLEGQGRNNNSGQDSGVISIQFRNSH